MIDAAVSGLLRRGADVKFLGKDPFNWFQEHLEVRIEPAGNVLSLRVESTARRDQGTELIMALDELINAYSLRMTLQRLDAMKLARESKPDDIVDKFEFPVEIETPIHLEGR